MASSNILKNQRLKEEQLLHIKTLLKQVKEKDKEVEKAAEVGHEQVEVALLEKFDTMKAEEAEVQGMQNFFFRFGRIILLSTLYPIWIKWWPHGNCTCLWIKQSRFKTWPGKSCSWTRPELDIVDVGVANAINFFSTGS